MDRCEFTPRICACVSVSEGGKAEWGGKEREGI